MRRFIILLFFVLIVCLVQTTEARKFALLIGIDDYITAPKLKCCVNDMKALKEALMKNGFEENDIQMLLTGVRDFNNLPTKRNIEKRIADLLSQAQTSDMVFIALSGHGVQEGKNIYFCPPDVEIKDINGTCVSINKIMDDLANCQAKFKWMVVDACRSDPNRGSKGLGNKGLQVIPTPPAGIALFQSCAEGEESCEDYDSGKGFFTKNLAAALSGEADSNHDGNLTLMEVCSWTTEKTKEQVWNSKHKSQRPYFSGSISDFTLMEDINVRRAYQLAAEAQNAVDAENYKLAIQKYDEAIALHPLDSWKRMRKLLEDQQPSTDENNPSTRPSFDNLKAGDRKTYTVNGVEFAFRYCPPGAFSMGSPTTEEGRISSENQHQVTLSKGFWMLETEVTQKQWRAVMGSNPSNFKGDDLPVEKVSWYDCQVFCRKCTELGLPVQLPTEAQWEYACRAGSSTAYFWGSALNGDKANCDGNYPCGTTISGEYLQKTTSVGSYSANAWNLFDMHGNVKEWCQDLYGDYPSGDVTNPTGPFNGSNRVIRGGCWYDYAGDCRSACRSSSYPNMGQNGLGFRCIKVQ